MTPPVHIAVCGPAEATADETKHAEEVGRHLAEAGAVVVCGGFGGVMDAAARGAREAGGIVVGVLPGADRTGASEHLTAAVATAMGEARNAIIVRSADAIIAIGGAFGTLSEIALALKMGKQVVGLETWELAKAGTAVADPILRARDPEDAVRLALSGRT